MKKWIDLTGYGRQYSVSSDGEVAAAGRLLKARDGNRGANNARNRGNYKEVSLVNLDFLSKYASVHLLVLKAFAGDRPEGHIARAKDGDLRNATVSNLEWAKTSEVRAVNRGEGHHSALLTNAQVLELKQKMDAPGGRARGMVAHFSREYGVRHETIRQINTGETYGWLKLEEVAA